MNDKFDAQAITRAILCLALAAEITVPARANDFRLGPLIDLSDPDSFAGCDVDGRPSNGMEKECSVAVNPTNPKNLVAAWIASRYKGIGTAVSFDGGKRWQQAVIPGVTPCTGGTSLIAADPWLTFAPNGDLYAMYNAGDILKIFGGKLETGDLRVNQVSKSTDGGLHWSSPVTVSASTDQLTTTDKPSITADPTDARFVYAVWNVLASGNRGQAVLARTTDGGQTWEPARIIYDPGVANNEASGLQIGVLPNGTLLGFFTEGKFVFDGSSNDKQSLLSVIRSADKAKRGLRRSASPRRRSSMPPTRTLARSLSTPAVLPCLLSRLILTAAAFTLYGKTRVSAAANTAVSLSACRPTEALRGLRPFR
jgi:hypothetical protein